MLGVKVVVVMEAATLVLGVWRLTLVRARDRAVGVAAVADVLLARLLQMQVAPPPVLSSPSVTALLREGLLRLFVRVAQCGSLSLREVLRGRLVRHWPRQLPWNITLSLAQLVIALPRAPLLEYRFLTDTCGVSFLTPFLAWSVLLPITG